MSYCAPRWISDFHLAKLLARSRANAEGSFFGRGGPTRTSARLWDNHRAFRVGVDGEVFALPHRDARDVPLEYAEPREVSWKATDGTTVGRSTARFFPYDHAAGGNARGPRASRVEVDGAGSTPGVTFAVP